MALLTVRETFQFALDNAVKSDLDDEAAAAATARRVETMLKLLDLEECADTSVGSDLVRGISGGQRKRVSIGEVLITNARALLLDEYSTGLDTSTTYDITSSVVSWAKHLNGVFIGSLLQPPPEVYGLFDNVLLLKEGKCVFFGPRDNVRPYLNSIGWDIPDDEDEADFLVEMLADSHGAWAKLLRFKQKQQVIGGEPQDTAASDMADSPPNEEDAAEQTDRKAHPTHTPTKASAAGTAVTPDAAAPLGAEALEEAWQASSYASGAAKATAQPEKQSAEDLRKSLESSFSSSQYGEQSVKPWLTHLWSNTRRQGTLLLRNPGYLFGKVMDNVLIGLALGSLFWSLERDELVSKVGCLVFTLVIAAFSNFSILPAAIESRDVIQKQAALGFYPESSFVWATMLAQVPVAFVEIVVLSSIVYWMPGLAADADRFLFYFAMVFITDLVFAGVFSAIAYAAPNLDAAQSVSAPVVGILLLYAGVLNTRESIPDFMRWAYWISPFSWSLRSLAQNELTSEEYDVVVPGTDSKLGELFLDALEIQTDSIWLSMGIVYNLAVYVLMVYITIYLLKNFRFDLSIGSTRTIPTNNKGDLDHDQVHLDVEPATLAFDDLSYDVQLKSGESKRILHNVSGVVGPGSCMALCGVSGAGKSTLLDVLAGRKTAGTQHGSIFINGKAINRKQFARVSGYVEQNDLHMPNTTVAEAIEFAAALRLPATLPPARKAEIVHGVMVLVELDALKDRLVGSPGESNALSPSQRKLLTIAVELVSQPSILFLDEPTSGLDSRAAANVMRVVRNIANSGRTVICTIHQPSKEVFLGSFDCMLLLQKGGHEVFCGQLGEGAEKLTNYLQQFPGVQPPKKTTNPATFMLSVLDNKSGHLGEDSPQDIATVVVSPADESSPSAADKLQSVAASPASDVEAAKAATDFGAAFKTSKMASDIVEQISQLQGLGAQQNAVEAAFVPQSLWTRFWLVLRRHTISNWRNHNLNSMRVVVSLVLGLVFGLTYLDVPRDTEAGLVSTVNFTTIATSFLALMNTTVIIPALISERAAYYREQSSHMYPSWVYSVSAIIVELPWSAFLSLVFALLTYWPAGLEADAGEFFFFTLVTFAQTIAFTTLGMAFAALMPDAESAQQLASLFTTIFLLVNGTFQPFPTIPEGWEWFRYVNPAAYTLNALASPQLFCEVDDPAAACPEITLTTAQGPVQVAAWTFVSSQYDLKHDQRFRDMGLIFVNAAAWGIIYILALRYVSHLKR